MPLLLVTAGHDYRLITPPQAQPASGVLTDGHAYSQPQGCIGWGPTRKDAASTIRVSLNLTVAAEASLATPFRLVSSFRAYFLTLDAASAAQPAAVSATCARGTAKAKPVSLRPVTRFPADGQMVIWDATLDAAEVATTCEFAIERADGRGVLLAEIEAYA